MKQGICGEQCPIAGVLLQRDVSAIDIEARVQQANNGRPLHCTSGGPVGEQQRCDLDPIDRNVLRAVAQGAIAPLAVSALVEVEQYE